MSIFLSGVQIHKPPTHLAYGIQYYQKDHKTIYLISFKIRRRENMTVIQLDYISLYSGEVIEYNFYIFNGGKAQEGKSVHGPLKSSRARKIQN